MIIDLSMKLLKNTAIINLIFLKILLKKQILIVPGAYQ